MKNLIADLRWLPSMWRIRRSARGMYFSSRRRFLSELQPSTDSGSRIAWPDALLHIKPDDVTRASTASADGSF